MSLYKRLTKIGTLSKPKGISDPVYSLLSTVNWMRALSLRVDKQKINSDYSNEFYSQVAPKQWGEHQINTVLEQLVFALHQCSALHALRQIPRKSDIARVGIVSWYYGVYAAASAMVAAKDGSFQDNHTKTAEVWDKQIAARKFIAHPFDLRITTLVQKDADKELRDILKTDKFDLNNPPQSDDEAYKELKDILKADKSPLKNSPKSDDEAYAACHAYLSGSVRWLRWKDNLQSSRDFKQLGLSNFRSKPARELRDKRLNSKTVGFLHQAFRYRGKANYRGALFLGYGGDNTETILNTYIDDLSKVLDAFVCQAGVFCSRRLGKESWNEFNTDLENGRAFSLSPEKIWGSVC